MKSVLLRLATLVAIVLGTVALAVPANAATVNSSQVAVSVANTYTVTPYSYGAQQCSGDVCIQRVTSVENNSAYIEIWANTKSFYGHFELLGKDGHWANSSQKTWPKGCCGWLPDVPTGNWTAKAWQYSGGSYHNIGQVSFKI
jgi:hypothetical protein